MTESISPEQMAAYRRTAVAREKARQAANAQRRTAALAVAQAAAALLRRQFGATRVVLFGSAARGDWFTTASDIENCCGR
jgi:predicted nucleotidyltransferase